MESSPKYTLEESGKHDENDSILEHFGTYPENVFFGPNYEAPKAKLEAHGYSVSLEIHNDYGREIYELIVRSDAGSTVWFYDPQEMEIRWTYIDTIEASSEEHARINQLHGDVSEIFAQTAAQRIDLDNSLGTESFDNSTSEEYFEALSAMQEPTEFDSAFAEKNGIDPESLNGSALVKQGLGNTARVYSNVRGV